MTPGAVGLELIVMGVAMTIAGATLLLLRRRRAHVLPTVDAATLQRHRIQSGVHVDQIGNDQLVGLRGVGRQTAKVVVLMPRPVMTPDEAIRHAAWLAAVAEASGAASHTLEEVLDAVRRT